MKFHELFPEGKPLIVVVHLPPLPGSPLYSGNFDQVLKRAVSDARSAVKGGADAVIVENFGDKPFREKPPRATIAALAVVARVVADEVEVPVGVNVLRNDGSGAVAVAHVAGAKFVRVNAYVEVVAADQGVLRPQAWDVLMARRILGADVAVLADVMVKHGHSITFSSITDAARAAAFRGLADAIIITGKETGAPPHPSVVAEAKKAVGGVVPVLVGSGVTPSNLRDYSMADGFIVGTYVHKLGDILKPIDPDRVRRIAEALKSLST